MDFHDIVPFDPSYFSSPMQEDFHMDYLTIPKNEVRGPFSGGVEAIVNNMLEIDNAIDDIKPEKQLLLNDFINPFL